MTRHIASITYRHDVNSKSLKAYHGIAIVSEDDTDVAWTAAVGRLIQSGPVWNNLSHHRGCFATRADALRALLDFIGRACVIRDINANVPMADCEQLVAAPHSSMVPGKVVASRSAKGTFLAS